VYSEGVPTSASAMERLNSLPPRVFFTAALFAERLDEKIVGLLEYYNPN